MDHIQQVTDPRLHYLRRFQSRRLRDTYADLAARPEFAAAMEFFFTRLYSTEDTTARDEKFKGLYERIRKALSEDLAQTIDKIVELHEISFSLDDRLVDVLEAENAPVEFDLEMYDRVERLSDSYDERTRQIELLEFAFRLVHRYAKKRGMGLLLRGAAKLPVLKKEGRVVEGLLEGHKAFHNIDDIDGFVNEIVRRETERLDRIYGRK